MNIVRMLVNNFKDVCFVALFLHHAEVCYGSKLRRICIHLVLFLLMLINAKDVGGFGIAATYRMLYRGVVILVCLLMTQKVKVVNAVYYSFFLDAVIVVCHNVFFTPLTRPLLFFTVKLLDNPVANALLCISLSNIAVACLYYIVYRLLPVDFTSVLYGSQIFSLALVLGLGTYFNAQMKEFSMNNSQDLMIQYSAFCIILQIALLLCLILNEKLIHSLRNEIITRGQLVESQVQLKQIERNNRNEADILAIRHDIKNHFSVLRFLIQTDEKEKALEYIDSLIGTLKKNASYFQTGCPILDALLEEKRVWSDQEKIDMDIIADFSRLKDMAPVDLCVIFGNLVDNAIEACGAVLPEQRYIRIRTIQFDNILFITIENSYDGKRNVIGASRFTSKAGGKYHGIGLDQVRNFISKNKGTLEIKAHQEQKYVSVTVRLPV